MHRKIKKMVIFIKNSSLISFFHSESRKQLNEFMKQAGLEPQFDDYNSEENDDNREVNLKGGMHLIDQPAHRTTILHSNKLRCDCDMARFVSAVQHASNVVTVDLNKIICSEPKWLENHTVIEASAEGMICMELSSSFVIFASAFLWLLMVCWICKRRCCRRRKRCILF